MSQEIVLVVDDSPIELLGCRRALEQAGFQVVTYHIKEFSEVFKLSEIVMLERPHVILMDVNLGLSAYDGARLATAMRKLREVDSKTPLIVLHSSMSEDELKQVQANCGADAFLEKGKLEQLPNRVRMVLMRCL